MKNKATENKYKILNSNKNKQKKIEKNDNDKK